MYGGMYGRFAFQLAVAVAIFNWFVTAKQPDNSWKSQLLYPEASYVHHGDQITLKCGVSSSKSSSPNPDKYTWTNGHNRTITDSRMLTLHSGNLVITDAQAHDEDDYYCIKHGSDGKNYTSKPKRVFVYNLPSVQIQAMLVYKVEECTPKLAEKKIDLYNLELCGSKSYEILCSYAVIAKCIKAGSVMDLAVFVLVKPSNNFITPVCNPACIKNATVQHLETEFKKVVELAQSEEKDSILAKGIKFNVDSGLIKATKLTCPSGYYIQAKIICVPCKSGTFSTRGENVCKACPKDTYQPFSGQKACFPCPHEGTTLTTGSNKSSHCTGANQLKLKMRGLYVKIDNRSKTLVVCAIVGAVLLSVVTIVVSLILNMSAKGPRKGSFKADPQTEKILTVTNLMDDDSQHSVTASQPIMSENKQENNVPRVKSAHGALERSNEIINNNQAKSRLPNPKGKKYMNENHNSLHSALYDDYSAIEKDKTQRKRHSSIRVNDWVDSLNTDSNDGKDLKKSVVYTDMVRNKRTKENKTSDKKSQKNTRSRERRQFKSKSPILHGILAMDRSSNNHYGQQRESDVQTRQQQAIQVPETDDVLQCMRQAQFSRSQQTSLHATINTLNATHNFGVLYTDSNGSFPESDRLYDSVADSVTLPSVHCTRPNTPISPVTDVVKTNSHNDAIAFFKKNKPSPSPHHEVLALETESNNNNIDENVTEHTIIERRDMAVSPIQLKRDVLEEFTTKVADLRTKFENGELSPQIQFSNEENMQNGIPRNSLNNIPPHLIQDCSNKKPDEWETQNEHLLQSVPEEEFYPEAGKKRSQRSNVYNNDQEDPANNKSSTLAEHVQSVDSKERHTGQLDPYSLAKQHTPVNQTSQFAHSISPTHPIQCCCKENLHSKGNYSPRSKEQSKCHRGCKAFKCSMQTNGQLQQPRNTNAFLGVPSFCRESQHTSTQNRYPKHLKSDVNNEILLKYRPIDSEQNEDHGISWGNKHCSNIHQKAGTFDGGVQHTHCSHSTAKSVLDEQELCNGDNDKNYNSGQNVFYGVPHHELDPRNWSKRPFSKCQNQRHVHETGYTNARDERKSSLKKQKCKTRIRYLQNTQSDSKQQQTNCQNDQKYQPVEMYFDKPCPSRCKHRNCHSSSPDRCHHRPRSVEMAKKERKDLEYQQRHSAQCSPSRSSPSQRHSLRCSPRRMQQCTSAQNSRRASPMRTSPHKNHLNTNVNNEPNNALCLDNEHLAECMSWGSLSQHDISVQYNADDDLSWLKPLQPSHLEQQESYRQILARDKAHRDFHREKFYYTQNRMHNFLNTAIESVKAKSSVTELSDSGKYSNYGGYCMPLIKSDYSGTSLDRRVSFTSQDDFGVSYKPLTKHGHRRTTLDHRVSSTSLVQRTETRSYRTSLDKRVSSTRLKNT